MALVKQLQTNFTAGVLDPKLAAREDISFYYNGLKGGKNMLVIPQGGGTARPALQFARKLTRQLAAIDLADSTITAPEGGTGNNLKDGSAATYLTTANNLSTTNPFIVAHIDLVTAQAVAAIDIVNYKLGSLALSGEFFVQYSLDNSAWSNFGTAFDWDAADRSRRMRNAAGSITARYWQIARIGATSIAAVANIAEVKFWSESADISNARLLPFAYSTQEAYMLAASDKNADIMKGFDYHGAISIPHTSEQIPIMKATQSLDTMLLFHRNVQPWKIFRQGGDDEFDFRYVEFENIPKYDYGAGTGGVNEVQVLNDGGTVANGDKFTILLEGSRTTAITANTTRSVTATNIQTALRALPNTSASGITVTDNADGFTVTFAGDDGVRPWNEMSVSPMSGTSVWSTSRTVKGEPEGEDIMSDARGWPRDGTFHQGRLNLVGVLGVPDAWLASVLGEYYNFDINQSDVTRALMVRADTDQVSAIYSVIVGRHLSFFTNDGEFYVPSEKIDHEAVLRWTTDAGSKEGLNVYRLEGALVFVQGVKDESDDEREIGTAIREFIYEETLQAYKTNLLSKLSSHLISNPVDNALRKSASTDEADILIIINEDGEGVNYTVLRDDLVNALMPMSLDGPTRSGDKLKAVAVDKKRRVYFVTERIIGGVPERFIEIWNDDLYLDCGGIETMEAETVAATSDEQDIFTWTFTSPATEEEIGVRLNGGRLDADFFTVDLGGKTITLAASIAANIQEGDEIRIAYMRKTVAGIDHLEGEAVQTFIDGTPGDDYVIAGGTLTLADYADTEIQYGFDYEVSGELMPFRIPESQTLSAEKIRIVNAIFSLHKTIGIEIKVNDKTAWQEVPLSQTDDNVLDKSALELLYTGEKEIKGLLGAAVGAPLSFRRPCPGPFTVLAVTREVII